MTVENRESIKNLATDDHKDPKFLGVSRRWLSDSVEISALHKAT